MSKQIDEVIASSATSLALAGDGVLDVSRRSGANLRRNSQAYLLVKPLAPKCVNPADLQQTFRRIWRTDGKFKVQQRPQGLFLFSFDMKRDRNRVLWGGPWYYLRAPMVIQDYDGLADFAYINLQSLFFWVRLENIPPRLETPVVIEDAAIVAGDNPHVDLNLLNSTGEVRVRVSHALDRPFIFEKVLKLAPGIVKNIVFFYENLVGMCATCKLIFHLDGICKKKVAKSAVQDSQKENRVEALVNLANPNYSQGSLKFTGAMPSILKPLQPQMPSKPPLTRKPIVIKK
ncbi:hypothetical protein ACLB2K_057335 [Fragaria x ananassa]